jgi:RHS repeat-associated protein
MRTKYERAKNVLLINARANRRKFTEAQIDDEETGLYYHGARYYAAWLGRWVSADPLGVQAGINVYLYGRASPVVFTDPSGLEALASYQHRSSEAPQEVAEVSSEAGEPVGPYAAYEQQELKGRINQGKSTFPSRQVTNIADKTNAFVKGAGGGDIRADRARVREEGWGGLIVDKLIDAAASVPGSPIAAYRTASALWNADEIAEGVGKKVDVLSGGSSPEKTELLYELAGAGTRFVTELLIAKKVAGSGAVAEGAVSEGALSGERARVAQLGNLPAGTLGATDKYGNITLARGLSNAERASTLRHELVHRFLSPRQGGAVAEARANFGIAAYRRSQLVRYAEEALAEGIATRSVKAGLKFPLQGGYGIGAPRLLAESLAYFGGIGAAIYAGSTQ